MYSSLSNNPAGWNKHAGWTFFQVCCEFIWLVIVKKYQIMTCRLEFFLKTISSAAGLFDRVEYLFKAFREINKNRSDELKNVDNH